MIIHYGPYLEDVDGVLKCVLWHDEIQECLSMCHEEGCGGHFGIEYTKRKIMQTQVTWASMYRDVIHWCRSCHECQLYQQRRCLNLQGGLLAIRYSLSGVYISLDHYLVLLVAKYKLCQQ